MKREEALDYIESNKMDIQRGQAAILPSELVFVAYANARKLHGVAFGPLFGYCKGTDFVQIIPLKHIVALAEYVQEGFKKDSGSISRLALGRRRAMAALENIWKSYNKAKRINNRKLLTLFDSFVAGARQWWMHAVVAEDKGQIAGKELALLLAKNHDMPLHEAERMAGVLCHPEKASAFADERTEFMNICLYAMRNKNYRQKSEFKKMYCHYSKRYFYKDATFYDRKEITPESFIAEVEEELRRKGIKELRKELSAMKTERAGTRAEKLAVSRRLQADEKELASYASRIVQFVDDRKVEMMKQFYYFFSIVHGMAEKARLDYDDALCLTVDEFRAVFAGRGGLSAAEMQRRKSGVVIQYEEDSPLRFYYGKDAQLMLEAALSHGRAEELRGSVAGRGRERIVKGAVKIVFNPLKDSFSEGEILVTSMTRIEFVPLMKKAKAIITDEGGIACHAAIVSRELGVPCITGTKAGTRTLADGDIVEMDMEKGVVRVLKPKAI